MKLKIKHAQAKILGFEVLKQFGVDKDDLTYDHPITIDLNNYPLKKIIAFADIIEEKKAKEKKKLNYLLGVVDNYIDVMTGKKGTKIKNLDIFKTALINHLKDEPKHLIYDTRSDDNDSAIILCFRMTSVRYETPYQSPPLVRMTLSFKLFGKVQSTSVSWYGKDVMGKKIPEIMLKAGLLKHTDELRKNYLKSREKFYEISKKIGKQYVANGLGNMELLDDKDEDDEDDDRYYRRYYEPKKFKQENTKVVVDIFKENEDNPKEEQSAGGESFWLDPHLDRGEYFDEDDSDETKSDEFETDVEIPIHPYIAIFDLVRHKRMAMYYSYLKEYVYDEKISEKLVLPENVKELVQSLIEHKSGGFSDIIEGKSGGVIILLSGRAGTGKTLTAEVYAESKKKALYNVQASQLGIKPKLLEKRLLKVLGRAERWDAILLIDEADVYVRERGNDLVQNTIVGVFLRVLEYSNAMLFMTTNRPDTVDDAIMSRCIARIDYVYPPVEDQKKIWRILADNSKIVVSDKIIDKFVEKYNKYSGRDIKNILKLGNLKAMSDEKPLDYKILEYVTRFIPTLLTTSPKGVKK